MEWILNAANIVKITWANSVLTVYFLNDVIVEYYGIPEGMAAGMASAASPGGYMNRYIINKFSRKRIDKSNKPQDYHKKLENHKDSTVGLWATDKPNLIPNTLKSIFFVITFK